MSPDSLAQSLLLPRDQDVFAFRHCRHGIMAFLGSDSMIGRSLDLYGEFAESENELITALVQPGDTVLDVGANVGTVSLPLSRRVGLGGLVFAFEPQRLIFQALCATLTLNGRTNVRTFHAAVGSNPGTIRVPVADPRQPANHGALRLDRADSAGESVALLTIDGLELPRCNLIKIDAEGMDYQVLLGSAETVARNRPKVYMEAKADVATPKAIQWLLERSYRCYWHFAAFYSPANYRGVAENVFGPVGDVNLLALPEETSIQVRLPLIQGPDADWTADYENFFATQSTLNTGANPAPAPR